MTADNADKADGTDMERPRHGRGIRAGRAHFEEIADA